MKKDESKILHIQSCARCGKDHDIYFKPLSNPSLITHWGMCPHTEEPVFLTTAPDGYKIGLIIDDQEPPLMADENPEEKTNQWVFNKFIRDEHGERVLFQKNGREHGEKLWLYLSANKREWRDARNRQWIVHKGWTNPTMIEEVDDVVTIDWKPVDNWSTCEEPEKIS